ncbi:CIC11C00000001596 [Sungouiella intermedia]|uniref:CIC11C00000001596 n=2 Tax=Sungouiella intermedia TaxID=45354 RepID=A0A1L0BVX0_9ASCO|nr:CIC11C00000001596 [[Candida] intermedia]
MTDSTSTVLGPLNQARDLAFSDKGAFPEIVRHILNVALNPDLTIQSWCSNFLREAFTTSEEHVTAAVKIDLAIDALPVLRTLAAVRDLQVFKAVIDVSIIVFKLTFRYVAENDGSKNVWDGINELKNDLVAKYDTQFPFELTFDREHDAFRNIDAKLELLKFVITVIDYQLRSLTSKFYSISRVNPNHTLIKSALMESEANALLDVVLKTLQNDILVTPIVTATFNHLLVLLRRKRQLADRILPILEQFDSTTKVQSNYETLETFKLSRKYADRTLRVLLTYITKCQLVPPKFQGAISRKLSLLTSRGDEIRKKNILLPASDDSTIKKRKFEGFQNASKKIKTLDYKNLYSLTDINSELNSFDLSTLPQNILISMALTALSRADVRKLSKALEIVSARYVDAVKDISPINVKNEADGEDEDDANGDNYDAETTYSLPPPKALSFQDKKEHVNLIVKNFFELANKGFKGEEEVPPPVDGTVTTELTRVAMRTWKQDSWLLLLTRLATRGMQVVDSLPNEGSELGEKANISPDAASEQQLSDVIRKALFDYFLENIKERVDLVIEWLNEEWYSEKVVNEQRLREQVEEKWYAKYEKDVSGIENVEDEIAKEMEAAEIPTPRYFEWAQKVLEALIPFLEPTDRKIFLRLLSDLPTLNSAMVGGIKSLCADPARSKLGFLSLQFLIMYRPPAKEACIAVLRELSDGDQADLKVEAEKLLNKYEVPSSKT